mmetsp:Transcript_15534/g.15735  ORF Transcript_15534/g.15735 Transcript_15534/m.15735 type:complete len:191 (-) Transcript_15534:282-854(-)
MMFAFIIWSFQIALLAIFMYDFLTPVKHAEMMIAELMGEDMEKDHTAKLVGKVGAVLFLSIRALPGLFVGSNLLLVCINKRKSPNPNAQRDHWKIGVVGMMQTSVYIMIIATGVVATWSAHEIRTFITASIVASFVGFIDEQAYPLLPYLMKQKRLDRRMDELIIDYGEVEPLVAYERRKLRNSAVFKED